MSIPQRERGSKVMIRAKCHGPVIWGHGTQSPRKRKRALGGDCKSGSVARFGSCADDHGASGQAAVSALTWSSSRLRAGALVSPW